MKRILLLLALFAPIGCGVSPFMAVPLGIEAYMYWKNGEATKYYKGDTNDIITKVKTVCLSFNHTIEDSSTGKFISHSQNHKFKWNIYKIDDNVTIVKCRIDFMGDKIYVELMYKELDKLLGVKTVKKHEFSWNATNITLN